MQRGAGEAPKSLGEDFLNIRKNKNYRCQKNTEREKNEDFNYVSKGMLKFITSNIDF